ncbi:hypothetical protein ACP70R_000685 [Stipagrostis hirtigluma subsp. patula]
MEASPPRRKPRPASPPPPPSLDHLPPEILDKIVSRLPLRDAVRTSALSLAWRRRWESVPGLRLCRRSNDAPPAAIGPVLARYRCPLREFRHDPLVKEAYGHADEWLRLLAGKGVQSLTLSFADYIRVGFPTIDVAIFSCRELTRLALGGCCLPSPPSGFAGFPNLTSLSLFHVRLPEHGEKDLEEMISFAPSLTSLELQNVWIDSDDIDDWVIRAPNLESLTIESDSDEGWQIEELSSLQRVTINVEDYSIGRDFVKLLTCFSQVTHLQFHVPDTKDGSFLELYKHDLKSPLSLVPLKKPWPTRIEDTKDGSFWNCLLMIINSPLSLMPLKNLFLSKEGNALEGFSCSFQRLENLTLRTDFRHISSILSTFSLLRNAPNLVELEIEITQSYIQNEEIDTVDIDFFNSLWTNDLFANMDSLIMMNVGCWSNEMHFIEFVLSKARILSALYVYRDDLISNSKPAEEAVIELAKYRRISPKAMVFFRNMEVKIVKCSESTGEACAEKYCKLIYWECARSTIINLASVDYYQICGNDGNITSCL